jgi:single-strand DNA-binding protein
MSSVGLNKWIVSGRLGADAEVKTLDLRNGKTAQLASATLYVKGVKNRDESFTVSLSIWEDSSAWRKLQYLTKGSVIICTGTVEPNPYISKVDNSPKAGLTMTVLDIDLDVVRTEDDAVSNPASEGVVSVKEAPAQPVSQSVKKKPASKSSVKQPAGAGA